MYYLGYYYGAGGGFFGHNWLLLVGVSLVIALWAQWRVSSAFRRWGAVRASSNLTGAEAAREILAASKINDVNVVETNDYLGDHYDPTTKRLCLSTNVFQTASVAALGIAAHETGHAIQHAKAYAPLQWRMTIVPWQSGHSGSKIRACATKSSSHVETAPKFSPGRATAAIFDATALPSIKSMPLPAANSWVD